MALRRSDKRWKPHEIAYAERHYLAKPMREIAADLGCSVMQVRQLLRKLGIEIKRLPQLVWEPQLRDALSRQLTDPEIAYLLNWSPQLVGQRRRRLGLPPTLQASRETAKRVWASMWNTRQKIMREDGVKHLHEYRVISDRIQALRAGWPMANSALQAQIMDLLDERPQTTAYVTSVIGRKHGYTRALMREMAKRGVIVKQGYSCGNPRHAIYDLAPGVFRQILSFAYHKNPTGDGDRAA